jgi:hypothetical protein
MMFIFNPQVVFSLNNQPENNVINIEDKQERHSLGRAHETALSTHSDCSYTLICENTSLKQFLKTVDI